MDKSLQINSGKKMGQDMDFTYESIALPNDYEGKVISTLISSNANSGKRKSVLYLHGFVDYFFHPHVAKEFSKAGFDFYALDLRKHGRSLLPHQRPNFCKKIEEYFEEISIAVQNIYDRGNGRVFLLAHSTGGLTAALYMNKGQKKHLVEAMILNSPFLDFNISEPLKTLSLNLAKFMAFIAPGSKISGTIPEAYGQSLHKDFYGEWDYNTAWKPIKAFATYFAWIRAAALAQQKLKKSNIRIPVLILHASASQKMFSFTQKAMTSDVILNVKDIKRLGPKLGKNITLVEIDGAVHDVFLSKKEVRAMAFKKTFDWLQQLSRT